MGEVGLLHYLQLDKEVSKKVELEPPGHLMVGLAGFSNRNLSFDLEKATPSPGVLTARVC